MKKTVYTALAGLLVCGAFAGCANDGESVKTAKTWEYEAATRVVYDCFGGDGNVMPLLGYWSAPDDAMYNGQYFPNMKNDEYFTAVKDAGINLLLQANDNGKYDEESVEQTLDYCDQYGIGYYVTDHRLFNAQMNSDAKTLLEMTQAYLEHESFAGYYIADEPTPGNEYGVNKALQGFYDAATALDVNIHPYVNMFPYYVSYFGSDAWTTYAEHIDGLYKDTGMPFIMYDIYCLKSTGFDYAWYYSNLSMARKGAMELNKSWIPYVSASAEGNYRLPTEGEMAWQVNQYIAFGAKGISYFPINSPLSFSNYIENGNVVAMFDWAGNKTESYYYVKEANKQLLAVDEYLMNATNHGVIFHGDMQGKEYLRYNELIKDDNFRELTSVSGDKASVGCFDYFGKTCLYVVNGEMNEDASVRLNFDDRYAYDVIQRGQTAGVRGKKIELNLAAGEAAFVILK